MTQVATLRDKKLDWSMFLIAFAVSLWLAAEFLLLGDISWMPYYAGGTDNVPAYLGLGTSQSGYSLWAPFIGGGVDRLSFWGSGDPLSLELWMFATLPAWLANGLYMFLQRFCAVYFTALVCRDHFNLPPALCLMAGMLHAVFAHYCVGHLLTGAAVPLVVWLLDRISRTGRFSVIWAVLFGISFSTVTSVAQGFPFLMLFFGLYFLVFPRPQLPRIFATAAVFSIAVVLMKYPSLIALVSNAPFSQRALWPHMAESVRSIWLGTFILWPESNFHFADLFSHLSSRLIQGFALVVGSVMAGSMLLFKARIPQGLVLQTAGYLKFLGLYVLIGSSLWIHLRDAIANWLPWIAGVQISRIILVPAAFLNALLVVLTLYLLSSSIRDGNNFVVRVGKSSFRAHFIILSLGIVAAAVVMSGYEGFSFQNVTEYFRRRRWKVFALMVFVCALPFCIALVQKHWARFLMQGVVASVLLVLLVAPKVTAFREHALADFNSAHYRIASVDDLRVKDSTLYRVASVLPLQPSYAYTQGMETVDGWILLYPRYYRDLWVKIVEPLVESSPRAKPVFDPEWKWPQDHYVFLGIGDLLPGESLRGSGMNMDRRFNMHLLSMLNMKYVLSEWPLEGKHLRLRSSPKHLEDLVPNTERDYSVGRYVQPWPERARWSSWDWIENLRSDWNKAMKRSNNGKEIYIYENRCVLPRFRMVKELRRLPDASILSELATATSAEIHRVAWIPEGSPGMSGPSREMLSIGTISIGRYSPDVIELDIQADGKGFLVIGNTWNPYWKVYVDGTLRETARTNHAQMGFAIRPGDRRVELRYEPPYTHWVFKLIGFWSSSSVEAHRDQSPFSEEKECEMER